MRSYDTHLSFGRRRGVLSAVGLGSVSDTLVHNLHCPTVVVKPPAPETACAATAVHPPAGDK